MPLCSTFTPTGFLELSSRQPVAETMYQSLVASYGGNFNVTPGSRQDCTAYAQAMGIAAGRLTLERAGNQALPDKVLELMPVREDEMNITPGPKDTIAQRSATLIARTKLPLGAAAVNVANALKDLLGSDFVAYRPTPFAEAVVFPSTSLNGNTYANLQLPHVPYKRVTLPNGTGGLLGTQTITYSIPGAPLAPGGLNIVGGKVTAPPTSYILAGDKLVVGPENPSTVETVTVISATTTTLTATFSRAHDVGCSATTQPYPYWTSTKRYSLIGLTTSAALDPEKRRKVHELMRRITRGVSQWAICDSVVSGGHAFSNGSISGNAFLVGQGQLGISTVQSVQFY